MLVFLVERNLIVIYFAALLHSTDLKLRFIDINYFYCFSTPNTTLVEYFNKKRKIHNYTEHSVYLTLKLNYFCSSCYEEGLNLVIGYGESYLIIRLLIIFRYFLHIWVWQLLAGMYSTKQKYVTINNKGSI